MCVPHFPKKFPAFRHPGPYSPKSLSIPFPWQLLPLGFGTFHRKEDTGSGSRGRSRRLRAQEPIKCMLGTSKMRPSPTGLQ